MAALSLMPDPLQFVTKCDPRPIAQGVDMLRVISTTHHGGAKDRGLEPRSLFSREIRHSDRPSGRYAVVVQRPDDLEAGKNAQRAVELASLSDRVEMGADQDRRELRVPPKPPSVGVTNIGEGKPRNASETGPSHLGHLQN